MQGSLRAFAALGLGMLLVGAGCAARQQAGIDLQAPGQGVMEAKTGGKAEIKVDGSVEGAVNAALEGMMEEQAEVKAEDETSAEVEADKAELNAYGEGSYELK